MDRPNIESFTIEHHPVRHNGEWRGAYRLLDENGRTFFSIAMEGPNPSNTLYGEYSKTKHILSCDNWCIPMVDFLSKFCLNWWSHNGGSPIYSFERSIMPEYRIQSRDKTIESILK